jgi:hypothetical protein
MHLELVGYTGVAHQHCYLKLEYIFTVLLNI